jgi:hypothetical protein
MDALDMASQAPTLTLLANVSFKIIARGLKPVVNVQGQHRARPSGVCGQEQSGGIGAAAERHGPRLHWRWR